MLQLTPARSRIRRAAGVAAGTLVVAAVAAGCGSSSSSSSGASASSGSGSANLTAAQQMVAQSMQRPAAITVSQPVAKTVPTGKKVVFISCGVSVCQQQGQIVAKAATALGWTSSTIATDGTPASVQAAYQTAIRQGVDAIVTTAALRAEIASQIPQLNAQKIVISDASSTDPVARPFIYNTSTASQNTRIERMLAAEVVADSKGKANTLYVNIPAFTILKPLAGAYDSYYKQLCPSCGFASIDVPLTQLAKAPNLIVSYLRSHPSVNYVNLSVANELDTGLPAALAAAGLTHVKVVGQGGGPTDFEYVANGQELALVPYDYYSVDYQMVDALARHFAGVPVQLTPPPLWMVTKANLPAAHSNLFPDVSDYQTQFMKLWGKTTA
jgi:ribose transport system substrate-binding protein